MSLTVSEALAFRRSTKHFDPTVAMTEADLHDLVATACLAPSSYNLQHWHIVAVRSETGKNALRDAAFGQPSVADASCMLVLAADPHAWQLAATRWHQLEEAKRERIVANIDALYAQDAQLCRDEAVRSASLFGMALMLVAAERGWQSCPYIGFEPDKVRTVAGLPEGMLVVLLIGLGREHLPPPPRPPRRDVGAVLHLERWQEAPVQPSGPVDGDA